MRHFDRSLPVVFREWMLKPVRQLRRRALMACLCVALTALEASWANAQEQFGEVHFPVACNAGVQKKFDRALAMMHTFSFPAAAKTFTAVAGEDPDCAMAYWGLAATAIGSLYGGRPGPMALQGEIAVEKAKAVGGKTPRERDYIATIEAFYRGAATIDYVTRTHAYAQALEQLHRTYLDDREAEIFYAYALSALGSPTDQTFAYQLKAAAILEKLLVELPNHPGVIHYLLHAYDNTGLASRGLPAARRLAAVAPSSPHALQFPAHIYVRLGLWQESIDTNRVGAAVEDLFFKPHAMDFLVHSYLQTGQDAAAKRVVDEAATMTIIPHILDAYAMAAMPARYAVDRRRWSEAASLTLPQSEFAWSLFPHAEATLVFARALGAARSGSIGAARRDLDRLEELRARLITAKSEGTWQEYWVNQIQIHHQMVTAWIAYTQGRRDEALRMLRAAADREDSTETDPVLPGHAISARALLGDLLMEMNEPAQALQAFEVALKREPSRFWTLFGAARAAERAGDLAKAKAFYTRLVAQTANADPERPTLNLAKAFLAKGGSQ
jgi:tetratricopeptide (TPR) repeat protein